jgi:hypothetical protein
MMYHHSAHKTQRMNKDNLIYLRQQLTDLGFGALKTEALEQGMERGDKEIQWMEEFFYRVRTIRTELFFKKTSREDRYYFEQFRVSMEAPDWYKEELAQTFYIYQAVGLSLEEGCNLLEGRSVNKDMHNSRGEQYNAWIMIKWGKKDQYRNFGYREFHQNYGYDLEKTLDQFKIKELENPNLKDAIMGSLRHGNMLELTIDRDGVEGKYLLEACPQYKSLNIFEGGNRVVDMNPFRKEKLPEIRNADGSLETRPAVRKWYTPKVNDFQRLRGNALKPKSRGR